MVTTQPFYTLPSIVIFVTLMLWYDIMTLPCALKKKRVRVDRLIDGILTLQTYCFIQKASHMSCQRLLISTHIKGYGRSAEQKRSQHPQAAMPYLNQMFTKELFQVKSLFIIVALCFFCINMQIYIKYSNQRQFINPVLWKGNKESWS